MVIGGAVGAVGRPPREDDGDAADGGAVQRRRRRRSRADRARGVPQPRPGARPAGAQHLGGDDPVRDHRLDLLRRLADRLRQAAGADRRAADRLPGAEGRERARDRDRARARGRDPRRERVPVAARRRDRRLAHIRRPLRPADRRRRHARRHLAVERLHGDRGLRGRLRAARERPDRQRRPRRRVRHSADAADGPGDEPLDHERALRRLRADPVRERARRWTTGAARARRPRRTSRSCSPTRAGW